MSALVLEFLALAAQCASVVSPITMGALVSVESSFNPYAIGVVGGALVRQPNNLQEAIATAYELDSRGANYSVGLAQINKSNFKRYGVTVADLFDPCTSLEVGSRILEACFVSAPSAEKQPDDALSEALACYYSGSHYWDTDPAPDSDSVASYIDKVRHRATLEFGNQQVMLNPGGPQWSDMPVTVMFFSEPVRWLPQPSMMNKSGRDKTHKNDGVKTTTEPVEAGAARQINVFGGADKNNTKNVF